MLIEREEFTHDGRNYLIDTDDNRIISLHYENLKNKIDYELERIIGQIIDDFEDGYNVLEEIDEELYEVHHSYFGDIKRKAYLM